MKFVHEPDSYKGAHALNNLTERTGSSSSSLQADDGNIRKLLSQVTRAGREQGDILPSLMARQCVEFYEQLDMKGRMDFLRILGREFGVDREEVAKAAAQYLEVESAGRGDRAFMRTEQILRTSLRPHYEKIFTRMKGLPFGMQFLVNLRADLLKGIQESNDPYLRTLNESLKSLLQQWFGILFLDLERITWNSSASLLEKIVNYEAVHAIPTWQALKQRLGPGRLCYAFFHREMPQEPLVFVQTALTDRIADNISSILADSAPERAQPQVATFYSISSSQKGLSGVELGNFLIKRVVKEIQQHVPSVQTFCTLSPVPRFKRWLIAQINQVISENVQSRTVDGLLLAEEVEALRKVGRSENAVVVLKDVLAQQWWKDPSLIEVLRPIMMRLCARYILLEKKRSFALDPVANFHIRNGACVYRLNWMGDTSGKAMNQSFGIMINYIYDLPAVEINNQRYLLDGKIAVHMPVHETFRWAVEEMEDGKGGLVAKL
ncbi:hypothetical protein HDV00_004910 [Rhizophlyctis rosea]|nr:hypothetical protein HDV00_004910 [Rhizophlyctis rosea]